MRKLMLLVPMLLAGSAMAADISIRADDWAPYNGNPASDHPGYMIEAARLIAERNGHRIDYAQLSWEEALAATRTGTIDCVVGAFKGDAPDFRFPEASWGRANDAFYVLSDNPWRYAAVADLASQRVARIAGYDYSDDVVEYFKTAAPDKVVLIDNTRNGLSKALMLLVTRRVDVVVESENVVTAKLRSMGLVAQVQLAGRSATIEDVYIACTPARPEGATYAAMFSEGLLALRKSGELSRILERYGLRDWAASP